MKKLIATAVIMFLCVGPLSGLWSMLFTAILGGGVAESYLYPLYGGLIVLAVLVVGCTEYVVEEIRDLKKNLRSEQENNV